MTIVRPGFVIGRRPKGMTPAPFSTTPHAVAEAVVRGIQSGAAVVYVSRAPRWDSRSDANFLGEIWRKIPG